MSNYTQSTFFAPKDSLTTGDPLKIIKGADIDPEFSAISTAIATKVDAAGTGLVKASTTLTLDLSDPPDATPAGADTLVFGDASDSDLTKKVTLTNLSAVQAGNGLSSSSGVLAVDVNELTTETAIAAGDYIAMYDASGSHSAKITFANLEGDLNHDSLTGFVSDEHVAHSGVSISAGTGLTGGGTIASSRTLSLDTGNSRNTDHSSVSITAGSGLTGGGTIASSRTINVGAGTGITVNANDVAIAGGVLRHASLGSGSVTVQSGGSPSGGSNGDMVLIY